mgnify:FL=1
MESAEFIWMDGEYVPWDEAKVHCINHTMHYGGGAFEGIRFYKTAKGPAGFRLKEHMKRLLYSAGVMEMDCGYSVEDWVNMTVELIAKNKIKEGYVRPMIYLGYGKMGINPVGATVNCLNACWGWGSYLGHEAVDVAISKYMRIHPKTTVQDAKITGHYSNSILASLALKESGAHEALFLDYEGNVAEGPGENVFLVKEGVLKTPGPGCILPGLTRDAVMTIARDKGYEVQEETLTKEDFYEADEAFFTGTAAEITPFASLDGRKYGDGKPGPISSELKEAFMKVVKGEDPKYEHYLTYV